jgi:D-glycero-D-manno-heptose 1,7-bisphosphate phosphatase
MTSLPAVFLDRDGVLNRAVVCNGKPFPPSKLEDVEIISGTLAALYKLKASGFIFIGITNQPDVARCAHSRTMVETINAFVQTQLSLHEIFTCFHSATDACNCRKPKSDLIIQAAEKYEVNLSRSWMVGDRWKDIAAGYSAGLKTIFIDYHYNEIYIGAPANYIITDTTDLVDIILKGSNENSRSTKCQNFRRRRGTARNA